MWLPEVMTSTPASNSASAVVRVRPMPPARFSPLAVTNSTPRSARRPGSSCSTARRPGLPMTSPIIRTRSAPAGRAVSLFGGLPGPALTPSRSAAPRPCPADPPPRLLRVLHRPRLADDGHLDLARIGQCFLDLANDVAREAHGRHVVDLLGPHEYAHLATRLDGKRPF